MEELLKECKKAYDEKDFSRLQWACDRILEKDSNNESALTYKAYCNWRLYNIIFEITEKIHTLYPNNFHAYNVEALAYMNKGKFENALECCEAGLIIKDYSGLRKNKIEALISLDRIDEAYEYYGCSQIPDYNFIIALVNCGKYSRICEYENEGVSKEELVDFLLKRCRHLNKRGWNTKEILEVCELIFEIDKNNETAFGYKINALQYLDKDDEAVKCCDHAIRLYPDNCRFYFYKADSLLWAFEDIDGAIECCGKGLSMVEDFEEQWPNVNNIVHALYEKADRLMGSGSYIEAIGIYDKILYYRPTEFKALENIESIVEEHDVNYEDTCHYNESQKLRQNSRERVKKIDDCLDTIEIGEYDDEYIKGCGEFKDYNSIEEYIRDLIIYLMESYPGRSEESARHLVKCNMIYIKSAYEYNEPVAYCSIEVGYCCG